MRHARSKARSELPGPRPLPPLSAHAVTTARTASYLPARAPARDVALAPPCLGPEEAAEVADTLASGWITTGPKTKAFEAQFGRYLGTPGGTSLMVSSCTAAMEIALATLGIGPGDEVIVPTLTFASTAHVVEHLGARPVLVDVLPGTLCIDPEAAERAVTPRTRALMPVHYAGHPAELDALDALAARHGLAIVEDAAHALPARYRGRLIGTRPNFAAFSFYATKNLTTAEGGALTADPELLERARPLALHGMSKDAWKRYGPGGSWQYDVVAAGFKANMTDLQASIGMHQLGKLARFQARRREVVGRYQQAFAPLAALRTPVEEDHVESAWHLYVLRLREGHWAIGRDRFIDELARRGIGTSVHFLPLHMTSFYRTKYGYPAEAFPVALDAYRRMVSLPLHAGLDDEAVAWVIDGVLALAARHAA
jgi:dTDP-4-amino-4,6-dideoxygalactose transaminase